MSEKNSPSPLKTKTSIMKYQQTESHSDDEMSDKKPKARDTKRQKAK